MSSETQISKPHSGKPLGFDRTLTFTLVLAVAVQSASALLWVGAAEARILALENTVNMKPPVSERLARIEEQMEMTRLSLSRIKDDPEGRLRDVRLHYVDGARDHQTASVFARELQAVTQRILDAQVPIVMDEGFARYSAERILLRATTLDQSVEFSLSSRRIDIEVGDKISLPQHSGVWQVSRMERPVSSGGPARITARASDEVGGESPRVALTTPTALPNLNWNPKPQIVLLDIPHLSWQSERSGPLVGAAQTPFSRTVIRGGAETLTAVSRTYMGTLLTPLEAGPIGRFDMANSFEFEMRGAELSSAEDAALLSGDNLFAVQTDVGWELLQAGNLELEGVSRYRAARLLRGQFGSDADMGTVESGAQIVWLASGLHALSTAVDIGDDITLSASAAGRESGDVIAPYTAVHLRPLSPVHARVTPDENGRHLSWIRRTRIGGDNWSGLDVPLGEDAPLFRVELLQNGETVGTVETSETQLLILDSSEAGSADMARISQGSTVYGFGPVLEAAL